MSAPEATTIQEEPPVEDSGVGGEGSTETAPLVTDTTKDTAVIENGTNEGGIQNENGVENEKSANSTESNDVNGEAPKEGGDSEKENEVPEQEVRNETENGAPQEADDAAPKEVVDNAPQEADDTVPKEVTDSAPQEADDTAPKDTENKEIVNGVSKEVGSNEEDVKTTEEPETIDNKTTKDSEEREEKDGSDERVETNEPVQGTEKENGDDSGDAAQDIEMEETKEEDSEKDDTEEPKTPTGRRKKKKYAETLEAESAHIRPESDSKRARKSFSAYSYQPENFKDEAHATDSTPNMVIPKGRGATLKDIPSTKKKIERYKVGEPLLKEAHKLLYGGPGGISGKGPIKASAIKGNLLEFSGYLPPENEDATEEEKEEQREKEEKIHVSSHCFSAHHWFGVLTNN